MIERIQSTSMFLIPQLGLEVAKASDRDRKLSQAQGHARREVLARG